jgi:hypothetical protein
MLEMQQILLRCNSELHSLHTTFSYNYTIASQALRRPSRHIYLSVKSHSSQNIKRNDIPLTGDLTYEITLENLNTVKQIFRKPTTIFPVHVSDYYTQAYCNPSLISKHFVLAFIN